MKYVYDEPLSDEDFGLEEEFDSASLVYDEPLTAVDFGLEEDLDYYDEEDEELMEDLSSSYPVSPMSEQQVRDACKKVVKGAKVKFGYVVSLKLDSKYAQGKFVKKDGIQYPVVKAIKVTETRACTGVNYNNTAGAKLLHSTQQYQDKLAARQAAGLGGFGTNAHDTEAGLENMLVTTTTGKKCILAYPLSTMRATNKYYISIDGSDWKPALKDEIAQYMSPSAANEFLHPEIAAEKRAAYQSNVLNNAGGNTAVNSDLTIVDLKTGERIRIKTSPIQPCYFDPADPYRCVFIIDKESNISTIPQTDDAIAAQTTPLEQDFPEVK